MPIVLPVRRLARHFRHACKIQIWVRTEGHGSRRRGVDLGASQGAVLDFGRRDRLLLDLCRGAYGPSPTPDQPNTKKWRFPVLDASPGELALPGIGANDKAKGLTGRCGE